MKRWIAVTVMALFCCGLLGGVGCVAGWAQPKPALTLDFANGPNGVGADGKPVVARVEGKVEIVDSKYGKALKSGPSTGYLNFPTKGIVSPTSGTVEMWVCPLDWTSAEEKFHVFFDVHGDGPIYLYKYYQGGLLLLSGHGMSPPFSSVSADISSWKPGEWHHIAGTWTPTHQAVYVDGKLIGATTPQLPSRLDSEFRVGDHPWQIPRTSSSLIAQVRIYDHALSDAHIAAHFAGDYNKVVPISTDSALLNFSVDPTTRRLTASAEVIGADIGAEIPQASFALTRKGAPSSPASPVLQTQPQPFVQSVATAELPLAGLPVGDYDLSATIRAGHNAPVRLVKAVTVPSLEWMGNNLGRVPVGAPQVAPPSPWTPLEVKGAAGNAGRATPLTVACWGRAYEFNHAALPTQIQSKGEALLASPITLNVSTDGQALQWADGQATVKSSSPTAVEIDGVAHAHSSSGNITLNTHLRIEYDGLMLLDVGLDTPPATKIDSISLDIPLRPAVAFYRHRNGPGWEGYSGNLAAGSGVVDSAAFLPYAWIGDNDRGLFWFCETAQQWPNWTSKNAFETVRDDHAVTMRFNLLAKGQTLPVGWRYECGLQATPVKPLPSDWRKWRWQPAPRANIAIIWPTPHKDSMKYYGYPEAADPALFAQQIKNLHAQGIKAIPYSCLTFLSDASPEWQWFGSRWSMGGGDSSSADVAAYHAVFQMVAPEPRSYSDFIVWKNQQFMKQFDLDGYYHDNTEIYPNAVAESGGGWRDAAGNRQPTYPVMAYRDLYRRLYVTVKTARPDAFLVGHMSGNVAIPILAYEDARLDGEMYRGRVKDSYMDVVSLDAFRAEFMSRQWGVASFFLPEFNAENAKREEPTRGLAGLLMLHDVVPWAIWCNDKAFKDAFDALDAFGYVDSDFIPYFDPAPPAKTTMQDVYVSVYKRHDGRALAIVTNVSRQDRSGTVHLDAARIGLPLDNVVSWPDKAQIKADGGAVNLVVPGLGYRMLLIGKLPS